MKSHTTRWVGGLTVAVSLASCQVRGVIGSNVDDGADDDGGGDDDGFVSTSDGPAATTTGLGGTGAVGSTSGAGDDPDDGATSHGIVFDVGIPDSPALCIDAGHASCDQSTFDPLAAIGLNCPGLGPKAEGQLTGAPGSWRVLDAPLGDTEYFAPREGTKMLLMSTGLAEDMLAPIPGCATCPSTNFGSPVMHVLPEPIDVRDVAERETCSDNAELIGTGDCSNTLEDEWMAGSGAYDYLELRLTAEVPTGYDALRYQFAFFSSEYPVWSDHESPWNDMYIAWLESEAWTGNISFDEGGNPISINGVLLDFRDAPSPRCTAPCEAPELQGFAMEGHAGTRWLQTVAPVVPGETIELVLAIFDLTDGSYDSAVVIDDWDWSCAGGPPITAPAG